MSRATQIRDMGVGETRNFSISYANKLDDGELLTGVPTITQDSKSISSAADLTLSEKGVSVAEVEINGEDVALGKAVQFRAVASSAALGRYVIKIVVTTDADDAQTFVDYIQVEVRPT